MTDETPILFTCKKCGWVDLPLNFRGIQKYDKNDGGVPMRMISVGCPKCDNVIFFTHFGIWHDPEQINYDVTTTSMDHGFPNKWQEIKE